MTHRLLRSHLDERSILGLRDDVHLTSERRSLAVVIDPVEGESGEDEAANPCTELSAARAADAEEDADPQQDGCKLPGDQLIAAAGHHRAGKRVEFDHPHAGGVREGHDQIRDAHGQHGEKQHDDPGLPIVDPPPGHSCQA